MNEKRQLPFGIELKAIIEHVIAASVVGGLALLLGPMLELQKETAIKYSGIFIVFVAYGFIIAGLTWYRVQKTAIKTFGAKLSEEIKNRDAKLVAEVGVLQANHAKEYLAIREENRTKFSNVTHQAHYVAHNARDLIVRLIGDLPPPSSTERENRSLSEGETDALKEILRRVYNSFTLVTPDGTKIFAAIRQRKLDSYITILREGDMDDSVRKQGTRPLPEHHAVVQELLRSYEKKDCVIITGSHAWPNDVNFYLGQDKSVLMGGGFSKRWNVSRGGFDTVRLEWILCVAADVPGAFTKDHKNLMKCFNDTCGIILNVRMRFNQ